jgi:hypothetical protein
MSDRLTLAHAIEDAGIERAKAERVASAIVDMIHDEVATKVDIAEVRGDLRGAESALKADIAALRGDLRGIDAALKSDIATVRGDLRGGDAALNADIAAVRADLTLVEHRMLTRLGGMVVVAVGIILAAIRYLPAVGHG